MSLTLLVAAASLAATGASAQTIVAPPTTRASSEGDRAAAKEKARGSLSSLSSALSSGAPLIQRGPIAVRPHLHYRFLYGDGIEAGPGNPRETAIHGFSAGVLVEIGKHWTLDYTPTWTFYSNEAFRDSFDQSAGLSGRYVFGDWVFGGSQAYESTHSMLVETGRQSKVEKHTTGIEAAYRLGRSTSLETALSRSFRDANSVSDAPEWTTSDWLQYSSSNWVRYRVSPRLNFAVGYSFGIAEVSVGEDMKFHQPQAQITWLPTEKISLSAQYGLETRTFDGGNNARLETPTYSGAFTYQPFSTTKLLVQATRGISASYFANEITRSFGWSAGVEQRFLQRLYFDATFSESDSQYLATRALTTARRDDRYRAINTRLSTVIFERTSLAVLFQTGRNNSNDNAYEFSSTQFGCELSHRF